MKIQMELGQSVQQDGCIMMATTWQKKSEAEKIMNCAFLLLCYHIFRRDTKEIRDKAVILKVTARARASVQDFNNSS